LLNDAVGSNLDKYANLVRKLSANNFIVRLICVHVLDVDELIRRVAFRASQTGRYVSESYVREAHRKIPSVFIALRSEVNCWQLVDGVAAEVVWERDASGAEKVHNAEFVRKLRS
jgi:predicted ABC-type ATPase